MDPITAATLAALAGGLGSEAGRHAWQGLTALVRRPFQRGSAQGTEEDGSLQVSSGELEVAALESDPADPLRAQALATALGVRAALDGEFRVLLEEWRRQSGPESGGGVHNSVTGETRDSTVVQGQYFSGLTFNMTRNPATPDRE
ncbi:hypothetical protein [Streptomyces qinzhouensis]|uniref:Uncharacterized protein n=1 Tax=Streptomyces qinzhouensis TaxID=2599401 RepID=A0A5B8JK71_9ACTN|nr:hypothetical protein [Streptomyces qinzhouensis]QDY78200.1 hypothetical protein FQU76_18790 [Streptomyces qinzhouensis]